MCLKCCLNLKLAFTIQQNMLRAEHRFQERISTLIKQESMKSELEDNSEYLCDVCGKNCPSRDHLGKHKRAVHVQAPCPVCGKLFKPATIKRHMEEVHETLPQDKYRCDICGSEKSTKRRLELHKSNVHGVRNCPICNKKIQGTLLKEHVLEHDPPNPELADVVKKLLEDHDCEICGKKYSSRILLKHHKYSVHLKGKCPICGKEFKKGNLKTHIARHEVEKAPSSSKYVCDICGKNKFSQADLTKHKYNVHVRSECPVCKKTISQTNLKRHIERHNDPQTVCELCGISVLQQDLRYHMNNVHSLQRYKCGFCDKVFKGKSSKVAHEKRDHLGEADFTCDTCGKRFFKNVNLKKHIESTHLKMRPHICEFCKVGFSSKFALITHRRQHTNERPFKCEFCGEGFRQKVSLKSHLKSQHDVEEELNCECKECGKKFASSAALISHGRIH